MVIPTLYMNVIQFDPGVLSFQHKVSIYAMNM
jgi:hypothetical protein